MYIYFFHILFSFILWPTWNECHDLMPYSLFPNFSCLKKIGEKPVHVFIINTEKAILLIETKLLQLILLLYLHV